MRKPIHISAGKDKKTTMQKGNAACVFVVLVNVMVEKSKRVFKLTVDDSDVTLCSYGHIGSLVCQCDGEMFSLSSLPRRVLGGSLGLARCQQQPPHIPTLSPLIFTRGRGQLAPKQVKHAKRHKGRVPIPTGGSTKGTTLAYGEWGIRIKGNGARLSAKQLSTAQEVIIKKLKVLKGTKVYLRVFPDIPVCIKVKKVPSVAGLNLLFSFSCRVTKPVWEKEREHSNIGRLGKIKFAPLLAPHVYLCYSVPIGRVIFEIGGAPIREELARDSASLYIVFSIH